VKQNGINPPTLQRLIALLSAGYSIRVQDSRDNGDTVSLEHPAKWQRVKEKSLWLREDGDVFGITQHADGTHLLIDATDQAAFQRLIASTPKPTWWELNNGPFYSVFAWIVIAVILFVGVKLMDFVIDLLRPLWA